MTRLALLSLLVLGCGAAPSADLKFSEIRAQVFQPSCNFSGCHNVADATKGNLDLKTDPYTALANVDAFYAKAKTAGLKRVVPGSPDTSFLYKKLVMPTAMTDDLGLRMPNTGMTLESDRAEAVRKWIARGAPND